MNPVHNILGFKVRLNWAEAHHGYCGLVLMGITLFVNSIYMGIALFVLGAYLFLDDTYQHNRQVFEFNPMYHSPVHRFIYDVIDLDQYAWFRKLNLLIDKLFRNL